MRATLKRIHRGLYQIDERTELVSDPLRGGWYFRNYEAGSFSVVYESRGSALAAWIGDSVVWRDVPPGWS